MAIVSGYRSRLSSAGVSIPNITRISNPDFSALVKEAVDSSSQQGTLRAVGRIDWSGSYEAIGHTPAVLPGATGLLEAAIEGASPAGYGFKGNVLYTGFKIDWDREAADMIRHTVDFGGNGALTDGVVATCPDDTGPQVIVPAHACIAKIATPGGEFAAIPEVRKMSLDVSRAVAVGFPPDAYPWPSRDIGPWDVKASVGVYAQKGAGLGWSALPRPGDVVELQLFVNATEFWLVKYMIVGGMTDRIINRATGEFVGATLNFAWSSHWTVDDEDEVGTITTPDETEIWPEA